jgi:hypothetical protein
MFFSTINNVKQKISFDFIWNLVGWIFEHKLLISMTLPLWILEAMSQNLYSVWWFHHWLARTPILSSPMFWPPGFSLSTLHSNLQFQIYKLPSFRHSLSPFSLGNQQPYLLSITRNSHQSYLLHLMGLHLHTLKDLSESHGRGPWRMLSTQFQTVKNCGMHPLNQIKVQLPTFHKKTPQ